MDARRGIYSPAQQHRGVRLAHGESIHSTASIVWRAYGVRCDNSHRVARQSRRACILCLFKDFGLFKIVRTADAVHNLLRFIVPYVGRRWLRQVAVRFAAAVKPGAVKLVHHASPDEVRFTSIRRKYGRNGRRDFSHPDHCRRPHAVVLFFGLWSESPENGNSRCSTERHFGIPESKVR